MKAISLHQPYASLIAIGIKTIETRSRPIRYRGEIAIHAAKRWTAAEANAWHRFVDLFGADRFHGLEPAKRGPLGSPGPRGPVPALGVVVAVAEVSACIQFAGDELLHGKITRDDVLTGDVSPGRFGWRLEGVRALREPLEVVGRQSLWGLTPAQAAEVLARADGRGTVLEGKHRQIVEHSLGLDAGRGTKRPYRDYFCASLGSPDAVACEELVALGAMRAGHRINEDRDRYFHVTEAGAVAVGHVLPKERA